MNKKRTVKPKALKPSNRLFLVVADDSKELHQDLYYLNYSLYKIYVYFLDVN